MGLVGREDEYRVVGNFVKWCEENHLQLKHNEDERDGVGLKEELPRPL